MHTAVILAIGDHCYIPFPFINKFGVNLAFVDVEISGIFPTPNTALILQGGFLFSVISTTSPY